MAPLDLTNPLTTLEEIVGQPVDEKNHGNRRNEIPEKRLEIAKDIDFGDLGLRSFLEKNDDIAGAHSISLSAAECEYV